ncbi:MAG: DUF4124 domain-containing protein [Pseudomonadota bacterium]
MSERLGQRIAWLLALPLVWVWAASAFATTVYKTVDDSGVVTFSDTPPEDDDLILVETLEIDAPPPSSSAEDQQWLEDMRETTDRMAADRRAREKHRAELRQLQAETAALNQPQEPEVIVQDRFVGYPNYFYPRYFRPKHPHHPHRPGAKPPLRPVQPLAPSTRPLPRNNYPASLVRKHYNPTVRAVFNR